MKKHTFKSFLLIFVLLGLYQEQVFRRVRFDYDIYLSGFNLTSLWIKLVSNPPEDVYLPLEYVNGEIRWKEFDQEGNPVEVASRKEGRFFLELNTFRSRRPKSSSQKDDACLFCRLGATSAWNEILEYKGWKVLANPFPIEKEGHFTIIPASSEHYPQYLDKKFILFALEFMKDAKNLVLIFNSWGAGASQNHLHFQALYKKERLPLEDAGLELIGDKSGVKVYRLKNYPAQGIVFEGGSKEERAGVITDYLKKLSGKAYNFVFTKEKVYFFPRAKESPSSYPQLKLGAWELAGRFVFVDKEIFLSIKEKELNTILNEITKI